MAQSEADASDSDKFSESSRHPAPSVKILVDASYLKSRGSVTVPGFRIARRAASPRWGNGSGRRMLSAMAPRRGRSVHCWLCSCLLICAVGVAGLAVAGADESAPGSDAPPAFDPLFASHRAVAHALGGIEGVAYSNSAQAFARSLALGFRLFEVDLAFAGSGALVCFHKGKGEWDQLIYPESGGAGSSDRPRFAGRFDMMTFRELLRRIRDRRDVFLILDTKDNFERVLRRAIEIARSVDPGLLGQIIPQLYRPGDLDLVRSLYTFDRFVFTLFGVPEMSEEAIRDFVRKYGLPAVAMPEHRVDAPFIRSLRREGALVYVHTLNDPERVKWALENGAHGIYTDFDTSLLNE
jgi:glycerophosphoryl diester phosphodiesterase